MDLTSDTIKNIRHLVGFRETEKVREAWCDITPLLLQSNEKMPSAVSSGVKPPHLPFIAEQILSTVLSQLIHLFCLKTPTNKLQLIKISQYHGDSNGFC